MFQVATWLSWFGSIGGGFVSGSAHEPIYNGRIFAALGDVVLVTVNYRLNIFGFLYTGDETYGPGNMGLIDQQMALKWVKNNIGKTTLH